MTAPDATILTRIRAAARDISAGHADRDLAHADYRAAQAEFLGKVLEAVRPCCRALGSAVGLAMTTTPAGTTTEPAPWRALYLTGKGPTLINRVPVEQPGYAREAWPERGRHGGTRLLLRADGQLVELSYDGPWTNVPGETTSWKATPVEISPAEAVARGYRVDEILDAIGQAMDAQADGNSAARAAEFRGKANRLRAFSLLVRGL